MNFINRYVELYSIQLPKAKADKFGILPRCDISPRTYNSPSRILFYCYYLVSYYLLGFLIGFYSIILFYYSIIYVFYTF